MFYKLIEKKRNEWLSSPDCTVKDFIDYIVRKDEMRDASEVPLHGDSRIDEERLVVVDVVDEVVADLHL